MRNGKESFAGLESARQGEDKMSHRIVVTLILASVLVVGCAVEGRNQGKPSASSQSQEEQLLTQTAFLKGQITWLKTQISAREADLAHAKAEQDRLQAAVQATEAELARLATVLTERNSAQARIVAENQMLMAKSKADRMRLQAAEAESVRLATALTERSSEALHQELLASKEEAARLASVLAEREAALTKSKAEQDKAKAEQDRLQAAFQTAEKEKALLANATVDHEAALSKAKAEQERLHAVVPSSRKGKGASRRCCGGTRGGSIQSRTG